MPITDDGNAYVVALVYAWLMEHPEYYSTYVAPYQQIRYCLGSPQPTVCSVKVGGHYRRRAAYKYLVPAMGCVCKFERLCVPRGLGTPIIAFRRRCDEEGSLIPVRYRSLAWG